MWRLSSFEWSGAMADESGGPGAGEGLPSALGDAVVSRITVLRNVNNAQMARPILSAISPDTLVQVVVGDDDRLAGTNSKTHLRAAFAIPLEQEGLHHAGFGLSRAAGAQGQSSRARGVGNG